MKKIILLLLVLLLSSALSKTSAASEVKWSPIKLERQMLGADNVGAEIWGQVRAYRGDKITLTNGQTYHFSKNVLVALENLAKNEKGNVRIVLDLNGKADFVFFHGIDMPDMFRQFGK
jgi:hypothetical protein